mgnify:CR=1 FL=1
MDIKSENILIDSEFNFKITDFGLSQKIEGTNQSGFETENFVGTLNYMAPEQHKKIKFSPQAVDLFAFAIVLFQMTSGTNPFDSATEKDALYKYICKRDFRTFWAIHE